MDTEAIRFMVERITGKTYQGAVDVIERGLKQKYDRRKFKERLAEVLPEKKYASELADEIERVTAKFDRERSRKRPKFAETETNGSGGNEERRKRAKQFFEGESNQHRHRSPNGNDDDAEGDVKPDMKLDASVDVQQVMKQAQKMIEQRKKDLNISAPTPAARPSIGPNVPSSGLRSQIVLPNTIDKAQAAKFMEISLDKQARMLLLKQKINNNMSTAMQKLTPKAKAALTSKVEVTEVKREPASTTTTVDGDADVIELTKPRTTLPDKFYNAASSSTVDTAFVDPRINAKPAERQRRMFKFHQKGEFEQMANRERAKAKLDKLQSEISSASKNTGISAAVKLAMIAPKVGASIESEVPIVEWWDHAILPDSADFGTMSVTDLQQFNYALSPMICALIEHPIQLRPPDEPLEPKYLRVYLTKKEQKKLRRQNRKERLKEITEKIRLGLEPAPEAKLKLSNFVRALGQDAYLQPTKMEAKVREQIAARLKKHEEDNASRKLTKQQKSEKASRKMGEDTSAGVHVSVYRVNELAHPAHKFKVEMNAKQLKLTGTVILSKDVNVVVVEGGPKQQRFFQHLMLRRIKWNHEKKSAANQTDKIEPGTATAGDDTKDATAAATSKPRNECVLVWEGIVKRRAFGDVKFKQCQLAKEARELFIKHGVPQYWDMALTTNILKDELQTEL